MFMAVCVCVKHFKHNFHVSLCNNEVSDSVIYYAFTV